MFNKDLLERVAATFGQAAIGAVGTNSVLDLGVDNWKMILSVCCQDWHQGYRFSC
jgi:hypothetical protein